MAFFQNHFCPHIYVLISSLISKTTILTLISAYQAPKWHIRRLSRMLGPTEPKNGLFPKPFLLQLIIPSQQELGPTIRLLESWSCRPSHPPPCPPMINIRVFRQDKSLLHMVLYDVCLIAKYFLVDMTADLVFFRKILFMTYQFYHQVKLKHCIKYFVSILIIM